MEENVPLFHLLEVGSESPESPYRNTRLKSIPVVYRKREKTDSILRIKKRTRNFKYSRNPFRGHHILLKVHFCVRKSEKACLTQPAIEAGHH